MFSWCDRLGSHRIISLGAMLFEKLLHDRGLKHVLSTLLHDPVQRTLRVELSAKTEQLRHPKTRVLEFSCSLL